jgi:hypothetical protein
MLTPGNANSRFEPVGRFRSEQLMPGIKKLLIELDDATEPFW